MAVGESEAPLGADEAAYVTQELRAGIPSRGALLAAAEPPGRCKLGLQAAKLRPARRTSQFGPNAHCLTPEPELSRPPTVEPARLDHPEQLQAILLCVDCPAELRL
jgi:hypothetical protein